MQLGSTVAREMNRKSALTKLIYCSVTVTTCWFRCNSEAPDSTTDSRRQLIFKKNKLSFSCSSAAKGIHRVSLGGVASVSVESIRQSRLTAPQKSHCSQFHTTGIVKKRSRHSQSVLNKSRPKLHMHSQVIAHGQGFVRSPVVAPYGTWPVR
jgi:hypothetical protein